MAAESKPGHKDEFDPNAPKGKEEKFQVKQVASNPDTGETVTPPVDGVTKYGPVRWRSDCRKEEIPYEKKREFDKRSSAWYREVVQKVKMEKTTNTNNEKSINKRKSG